MGTHISTNYFTLKRSRISNKATSNFQAKNMKVVSVGLPLLILFVFPFVKTEKGVCTNWFGNNIDWDSIPYEQYGNSGVWGLTPEGCTKDAVSDYGAYYCAVQNSSTFTECNGDCFNGQCVSELKCQTNSWYWTGEDTEKDVAPYMVSSCSECIKNFHQKIIDIVLKYGVEMSAMMEGSCQEDCMWVDATKTCESKNP